MKPLVAIVGRPNVGKSTLFNRLVGRRLALVGDLPGVTRDRNYADAEWNGRAFTLIDTGGFVPERADSLLSQVQEQAQAAVEECDLILLVVDARAGANAADQQLASYLRKSGKPIVLAVNKVDDPARADSGELGDFHRLGLGDLFAVSAEHAIGLDALLDQVVSLFPAWEGQSEQAEEAVTRIAIVGRPNVGKSTLVNALLGEKRLVANELPGTTRDPIDSRLSYKGRSFVLTDTAGIRRKSTIAQRVEQFASMAALRSIERSQVAALVMDATEPAVDQDAEIASIAEDRGRALLLVVNKCDLLTGGLDEKALRAQLKYALKFVSYAPVVFTSAAQGLKVEKVLELGDKLAQQLHLRVPTPRLNRLLAEISDSHPAPLAHGRPVRLYYIAQVGTAPPTFALTSNRPEMVPAQYKRYVVNRLRAAFGLKVPVRLLLRERPGRSTRTGSRGAAGRND
ncbi:MAG TPA: ribosome biogenesis GTPase Der [Myxococcaceae bacterium]|nr:ribosome biogenesis GTPase Der [Myxococcaceae bacterium]